MHVMRQDVQLLNPIGSRDALHSYRLLIEMEFFVFPSKSKLG